MNVFDIGIILILISFIVVGCKRGVIKEAIALVATILVFVLSFSLKGIIGNLLCMFLPFFDLDGFVVLNIFIYQLIAFIIVFLIMLSIYGASLRLSKVLQKIVNATIILVLPSKLLGGVVSFLKGYLILFIIFIFLMIPFGNFELFRESACIDFMVHRTPVLSSYTRSFVDPVTEVVSLSSKVANKKITVNEANLEALDIMLKYKVVEKDTVESLIEFHKIEDVDGIDEIVSKY